MTKTGRNDECPCGSGKKYKACYLLQKENNTCKVFLNDISVKETTEHLKREERVMEFLQECVKEFEKSLTSLEPSAMRVRLLLTFTLLDICANYWYEFLLRPATLGKQSERMKLWFAKYCNHNLNQHYNNSSVKNVDINDLVVLRNSIVHFLGLGEQKNIIVQYGNPTSITTAISKKLNRKKLVSVDPHDLYLTVMEGAVIMLDEWATLSTTKDSSYINGIEKIYNKIQKEGAVTVEQK